MFGSKTIKKILARLYVASSVVFTTGFLTIASYLLAMEYLGATVVTMILGSILLAVIAFLGGLAVLVYSLDDD